MRIPWPVVWGSLALVAALAGIKTGVPAGGLILGALAIWTGIKSRRSEQPGLRKQGTLGLGLGAAAVAVSLIATVSFFLWLYDDGEPISGVEVDGSVVATDKGNAFQFHVRGNGTNGFVPFKGTFTYNVTAPNGTVLKSSERHEIHAFQFTGNPPEWVWVLRLDFVPGELYTIKVEVTTEQGTFRASDAVAFHSGPANPAQR